MKSNNNEKIIEFCISTNFIFESKTNILLKNNSNSSTYKDIQQLVEITSFLYENNIKHKVTENGNIQLLT
ncbi:hypothetical protein [Halarcobacter ebronensis]|uniref:hypothetical protein n=1 Tax=Halarcobacter ebronensis TaxID=1462615 RepID=UPI001009F72D|nr:hypothetical protein [Halarcobacter ebronensis]